MSPEDLQRCIDLLQRAAEELAAAASRQDLPPAIATRMTAAHVGIESLRLSTQSIQLTLRGKQANGGTGEPPGVLH